MTQDGRTAASTKRWRRRLDKPPIVARLVFDSQLKGDVGILSDDLWKDLYPNGSSTQAGDGHPSQATWQVAMCPRTPLISNTVEDAQWTIVPIKVALSDSVHNAHSTVHFSSASLALQTFARALQNIAPSQIVRRTSTPIEVLLLDIVPLVLEKVFVSVDVESLQWLHPNLDLLQVPNGATTTKPAHHRTSKSHTVRNGISTSIVRNEDSADASEHRLRDLVRDALSSPMVVHEGDLLPLALPAHPITHVNPPPARVTLCEPVSQGILAGDTTIIVTRVSAKNRSPRTFRDARLLKNVLAEEEEDTSDDRFYSAAEDKTLSIPTSPSRDSHCQETETEDSEPSCDEAGDLSDDSSEDIISLQGPVLASQISGSLPVFQAGTPRALIGPSTNGISSPGSVMSNYTSITARPGDNLGRLFKVSGLKQRIHDDSIHPKPANDEDDEARVYVDTSTLVKIGCFSGDWIRLRPARDPTGGRLGIPTMPAFEEIDETLFEWRAARVFGLPEAFSQKPHRFALTRNRKQMSSFAQPEAPTTIPTVHMSPILLANLGSPSHLRLSPTQPTSSGATMSSRPPRSTAPVASMPSLAREVTLLRLSTPLSVDRALQGALLTALKGHFEGKQRLVKTGDLVAIRINVRLGRILMQGKEQDEHEVDGEEFLSIASADDAKRTVWKENDVAWFQVGRLTVDNGDDDDDSSQDDQWGGLVAVDSTSTRMVQSGSSKGRVPSTSNNSWKYYLGKQPIPGRIPGITPSEYFLQRPTTFHVSPLRGRLRELISAAVSSRAIQFGLPPVTVLLNSTQRGIGKAELAKRACEDIGIHLFEIDAYDIIAEGGAGGADVRTEALLKVRCERAMTCGAEFCAILIRHVDVFTADRLVTALSEVVAETRILIATTTDVDKVPEGVRGLFTHELKMSAPDEKEREGLLRSVLEDRAAVLAPDVDLAAVALKTAALVAADLVDVIDRAMVARRVRLEKLAGPRKGHGTPRETPTARDVQISGGDVGRCLTKNDFNAAVDAARINFADAIGAPKIPTVGWEDVGGLTHVKDAVMETIQLPLERPELFAKGLKKRSGILFYGPPGTGKTLLAKAIATEFSLNFFSVKGPELLNMYIGESEANVRRVFQRARDARPCVVFFDELDSVAPKRGNQGDSGGVMDRIVSQLLAELDGMSNGEDGAVGGVFVIGATNRPDLLDAALLRPGRFDKMLYLGIPDTHDKQLTILEALTRKFTLHPQLSLRTVAEKLPYTYTGADLYALCSDAMLKAITRKTQAIDDKIRALPNGPVSTAYFFDHFATEDDVAVMVTEADFFAAEQELVGSVSAKELEHYARVRATFEANDAKAVETQVHPPKIIGRNPDPAAVNRARTLSTKGKVKAVIGKGKGKGKGKSKATLTSSMTADAGSDEGCPPNTWNDDDDEDDSDHVIRTAYLKSDGGANGNGSHEGVGGAFEDSSKSDDEALYE